MAPAVEKYWQKIHLNNVNRHKNNWSVG